MSDQGPEQTSTTETNAAGGFLKLILVCAAVLAFSMGLMKLLQYLMQ